jgi:hypothetical protein
MASEVSISSSTISLFLVGASLNPAHRVRKCPPKNVCVHTLLTLVCMKTFLDVNLSQSSIFMRNIQKAHSLYTCCNIRQTQNMLLTAIK